MSSPNQLSFLPDDYLDSKRQKRTNVLLSVVFVAILAAVGGAGWYTKQELRKAETEHDDVDRQFADAAKRIEQVRQMQDKQRKMAGQAELTASLLEKVPRSFLLAEITNAMPAGVSLLDVILDSKVRAGPAAGGKSAYDIKRAQQSAGAVKGPAAPQAKNYDVGIRVQGIADNDVQVAQFMAKLNTSKLLRDVNLVISDEYVLGGNSAASNAGASDTKMRKFQIEMTVDPTAEITPGTAASIKTAATPLDK
ncbi:MAG TPA: PilN domain-containing protein [Tepidisphaeraceae bacterium]|nr:PilN domain-containing protein [Tepidisphaeraceae bacterium]